MLRMPPYAPSRLSGAFCRSMIRPMSPVDRAAVLAPLGANGRAGTLLRAVLGLTETKAEPEAISYLLRMKDVVSEFGVSLCTARRWARRLGLRRFGVLYIPRSKVPKGKARKGMPTKPSN